MRYRNKNRTDSNTPRTLVAKYAGKCASCGGSIAAGQAVWWVPKAGIYHLGNFDGAGKYTANSAQCAAVLSEKIAAYADPGEDAADRWNETHW